MTTAAVTRTPLTGIRKAIAERMAQSHAQIPGVHVVEECDVTRVDLRLLLAHVCRAVAELASAHPLFNAHVVGDEILAYDDVAVGFAVDTPRGLVVPVLRDPLAHSPEELTTQIAGLAERARAGRIAARDISGATVTVTSPGRSGGILATPLINPPQTAIIGVHRATERVVAVAGAVAVRRMLNLTVTFDHRVIDGAEAGRYARGLRAVLEREA
ncbi:2-oxo acid dehydrogenase subunit E2 [Nocardioides humi]|uniref:2-oxoacid dehydrogenase acyltransferase catalytic domain-containing protein n=1 Tax=Nocardioides humi TaxID=449461 RepID=A0ABN2BD23_9ACTN|nr:2-oxo acid dehydrogenase subunit E2 [Nocardioides humi]